MRVRISLYSFFFISLYSRTLNFGFSDMPMQKSSALEYVCFEHSSLFVLFEGFGFFCT